ncbi:DUF4342 domain-containing protein [Thalassococcus sp. CAU 1522]|uniref:DUF4342 domain-containing protein n=1 Tax=Thalassococcus arenae TaxID=2851652 RepID=A0ABS6N2R8_9RHOB|nr:DUF4342 domain-containing protein [Thalassococcus arenae]MBV2358312.1 DUF4342 domain-containing protein [Thalassococcus arenae]
MTDRDKTEEPQSIVEVIEVGGEKLVGFVKEMAREGNVRRLRVIEPDGDVAVDVSLTVGALTGGAVVLAAPVLAVIGALAALVTKVKVEVVRETADETTHSA